MNKGKKPMPKNIRKRVIKTLKKDLKDGLDSPEAKIVREYPKEKDLLAKQPKKKAKILQDHLTSTKKSIQSKKAKAKKKISKRTSPKDAIVGSVPSSVHKEGSRWIKSKAAKTKAKNTVLIRKTSK